jgi:hypothetical protein
MNIFEDTLTRQHARRVSGVPMSVQEQFDMRGECTALLFLVRKEKQFVKKCSCGRIYYADTWLQLPIVGHIKCPYMCQFRNCVCKSTLSIVTRIGSLHLPASKALQGSSADTRPGVELKTPFSVDEAMNVMYAWRDCPRDIYMDQWTDEQTWEAARYRKSPNWTKGIYGNYIPA